MKVTISYPPLASSKGIPLLSQNRQFQWFKSPTYIYPVVPAYAASLLKSNGFNVVWDDGIAEDLSYQSQIPGEGGHESYRPPEGFRPRLYCGCCRDHGEEKA
jgi:hypothetical protein